MPYVIEIVPGGRFVKSYDPDAGTALITGDLVYTTELEEAKRYPRLADALDEYRRRSRRVPNRPDGQPNRPMTTLTVTFRSVDQ